MLTTSKETMFGKHFSSMYEGSMRGAGSAFFAVWGYVISHMVPCRGQNGGTRVELNSDVIAFLIGEEPKIVQAQIDRMCAADPKSRTKVEEGRRLVKMGEYEYVVVNGDKYRAIRDEESRREQNKQAKRRERARKNGQPLPGEAAFTRAMGDGNDALADEIAGRGLPESKPLESADEVGARALRIARGEEEVS